MKSWDNFGIDDLGDTFKTCNACIAKQKPLKMITCECGTPLHKASLSKHMNTYDHDIRMMYPNGFIIEHIGVYLIKIRELSEETITNIRDTYDILGIRSTKDYTHWCVDKHLVKIYGKPETLVSL